MQLCDPGVVSASFVSVPAGRARGKLKRLDGKKGFALSNLLPVPVLLLLPVLLSLLMSP